MKCAACTERFRPGAVGEKGCELIVEVRVGSDRFLTHLEPCSISLPRRQVSQVRSDLTC